MEYFSKTEDIVYLAYQLKSTMENKISINKFGLYKEILNGKYRFLDSKKEDIDFTILYSKNEFLRVSVGEIMVYRSYDEKLKALNEICASIIKIIGSNPVVFYNIDEYGSKIPYYDWAFTKKQEYIDEFVRGTMFDDAKAEDLVVFQETVKEKVKTMAI